MRISVKRNQMQTLGETIHEINLSWVIGRFTLVRLSKDTGVGMCKWAQKPLDDGPDGVMVGVKSCCQES